MKPNPLNRPGSRNSLCPLYDDCLDRAVKRYWLYWDCAECTHKSERQSLSLGRGTYGDLLKLIDWGIGPEMA